MIECFLKRKIGQFALDTHRNQVEEYVALLAAGENNDMACIVALAAMIRRQLIKINPSLQKLLDDGYSCNHKELADIMLNLGRIEKTILQEQKSNSTMDIAGLHVWLQTLRCMAHPELYTKGRQIWQNLQRGMNCLEEGLTSLRQLGVLPDAALPEIRKYANYIPTAFKVE